MWRIREKLRLCMRSAQSRLRYFQTWYTHSLGGGQRQGEPREVWCWFTWRTPYPGDEMKLDACCVVCPTKAPTFAKASGSGTWAVSPWALMSRTSCGESRNGALRVVAPLRTALAVSSRVSVIGYPASGCSAAMKPRWWPTGPDSSTGPSGGKGNSWPWRGHAVRGPGIRQYRPGPKAIPLHGWQ